MSLNAFLVKVKLELGLGLGLILMASAGVASYVKVSQLIDTAVSEDQIENRLLLLERTTAGIKTAEASLRQYLLTGDARDLQKVGQTRAAMEVAISRMRSAGSLPEQPVLDDLMAQRLPVRMQSLAARQSAGLPAAVAILTSDLSRQLRQRTEDLLDLARERETLTLDNTHAAGRQRATWAQRLIMLNGLLFLAMLAWAFYVVRWHEAGRKRVEAQLRDSEVMSRSITESMAEGVITTNVDDIILDANGAALELLGYEKSDLKGRDISELIPQRLRGEYKAFTAALRDRPEAFRQAGRDVMGRRRNGSEFLAKVSYGDMQVAGQRLFRATFNDITETRRITEALRASETQLRQITDTVPALISYLDKEQRFSFHNKAYEEVLGLSFAQINGQSLASVLGAAAYADVKDKADEVLRGYPVRYERVHTTPEGSRRSFAMQYLPRYGEGANEGEVMGFFALGTDITELKRIDRMKTEFISTVSHELRTPLTSIRGSLGLISGGVAGEIPAAVKNLVGIAKSNCERLIRLINDMLDSEKIESGKMRLDLQLFELKPLMAQALAANEGFAAQHRVKLELHAPPEALRVRIDSDRMTQVLTNLLSNAAKFSPADSTVEVRLTRVARSVPSVRVEVIDHGSGIPEEFRSRIFQKFSQADASDTRQKGGSGLGLNISRALIEQMNGIIGFSSEAGVGTTFFFELPECQEAALPASSGSPTPSAFAALAAAPQRFAAAAAKVRILVCEGDPDVARLISMMLGKAGFQADMALSAAQAQACLAQSHYDAVTVDLKLPDQSGAAFISALRSADKTRELPVVVIAAQAEQGKLQFSHKPLTVTDWLAKPIDESLLILSVRRAVGGLHGARPRILHVEDDPDIQCIAAAIVQDYADFEFAATLGEARALLGTQHYDLVLLDLGLGDDSGWDLVGDIDALDPRPPVIVFSASDVDPADGSRAQAVLVKARTSNSELLHAIQRELQIPGDPGPSRPMTYS